MIKFQISNFKFQRKAFSLVELIVVIAIIGILSVVSYVAIQKAGEKSKNEKMLNDLIAISSALESYKRDHSNQYPIPKPDSTTKPNQNIICYYMDATYAHSCKTEDGAVFTQGMIDNTILSQRYLRQVPLDPRTSSRYVYGVTNDGAYFQVAGIYEEGDEYKARVVGNLAKGFELPSIIRAFDKADFVIDKGTNLPYSSNATEITGTLDNLSGTGITVTSGTKIHTQPDVKNGFVVKNKDVIITKGGNTVDIYFSDGSITHVDADSELELKDLKVDKNDGTGTVTKILIKLKVGKIWNKVTRLGEKSEFNVETTTAIAGVRGTEFGVEQEKKTSQPVITILSGEVGLYASVTALATTPAKTLTGTITAPTAYTISNSTTATPTTVPSVLQYYKDIPLGINMRPILLSVKGDTKTIVAQNINYYVNSTDSATNRSVFKGQRKIDATDLVAYEDNQGNVKVNISGNPHSIAVDTANHSITGLPLDKPLYFRFEKRSGGTVLRSSAFTTPITIKSTTSLSKSDLTPKTTSTTRSELTLSAPRFATKSTSKSFDLKVSLDPYTFKTGDKYNVKVNSGACSSSAVTGTGDISITSKLNSTKTIPFTASSVGDCEIKVQANVGSLSLIKIVKVNIRPSTEKLVLTYPKPGGSTTPTTLKKGGKQVTFRWQALNPPAGVKYNFYFDGKLITSTSIADQFYPYTLPPASSTTHNWAVEMLSSTPVTVTGYLKVDTATNVDFQVSQQGVTTPLLAIGGTNQATLNPQVTGSIPLVVDTYTITGTYDYQFSFSGYTPPTSLTKTVIDSGSFTINIPQPGSGLSKYVGVTLTVRDAKQNLIDTVTKGITVSRLPMISTIRFKTIPSAVSKKTGESFDLPIVEFTTNVTGSAAVELVPGPTTYTCDTFPTSGLGSFATAASGKSMKYTATANSFSSGSTTVQIQCTLPSSASITGYSINTNHITGTSIGVTVTKAAAALPPASLSSVCTGTGRYWDGSKCWVLGVAGDSCTTTCGKIKLGATPLKCVLNNGTDAWVASKSICTGLGRTHDNANAKASKKYAPYINPFNNKCHYRKIVKEAVQQCSLPAIHNTVSAARICQCK